MKIADVMTREVASCRDDDSAAKAAWSMWERDCGVLPVTGPDGELRGMVTDRDLCMAACLQGLPLDGIPVSKAMAWNVQSCRADDDLGVAHKAMRQHQLHRLPVVDEEGIVVGIVSLNDLARTAAGDARQSKEVAATLAEICRHRTETAARTATAAAG